MNKKYFSLKRMMYFTGNSWNRSKSLAYNLKVYKVIKDDKLINKIFNILGELNYQLCINNLIDEFDSSNNYEWQAGFNGRSGGYLVLYSGGIDEESGRVYTSGRDIKESDVPSEVKKKFRKLAIDIIKTTIEFAENNVEDKEND